MPRYIVMEFPSLPLQDPIAGIPGRGIVTMIEDLAVNQIPEWDNNIVHLQFVPRVQQGETVLGPAMETKPNMSLLQRMMQEQSQETTAAIDGGAYG